MRNLCILMIFVFTASTATAATPTYVLCIKGTAIVAKQKCGKGEVKFDLNSVSTQGVTGQTGPKGDTGPQGSIGPQGIQGTIKLNTCHTISDQNAEISGLNDITQLSLSCTNAEFLLNHYGVVSDTTTTFISTVPLYFPNEGFPSGVTYYFARIEPQNTTTVISSAFAVCCSR